jgi:hypothetical protein
MDAFGAGALFFLLGVLSVGLQADYPFACAFQGLSGDYRKAAIALSRITNWRAGTLMKFWALSWVTVPLVVFAVVFWFVRAVRVRRVRRAQITRMMCDLNWVASISRCKEGSQDAGAKGEPIAEGVHRRSEPGPSPKSDTGTLGDDKSQKQAETKPKELIKVLEVCSSKYSNTVNAGACIAHAQKLAACWPLLSFVRL